MSDMHKQSFYGSFYRADDRLSAPNGEHPDGPNVSGCICPEQCRIDLEFYYNGGSPSPVWMRIVPLDPDDYRGDTPDPNQPARILELDADSAVIIGEALCRFGGKHNVR